MPSSLLIDPVSVTFRQPVCTIINTEGFTAGPALVALAERAAAQYLCRNGGDARLRLTVVREAVHGRVARYVATAHLEQSGQNEVTHAAAVELDLAVQSVMAKAARKEAAGRLAQCLNSDIRPRSPSR